MWQFIFFGTFFLNLKSFQFKCFKVANQLYEQLKNEIFRSILKLSFYLLNYCENILTLKGIEMEIEKHTRKSEIQCWSTIPKILNALQMIPKFFLLVFALWMMVFFLFWERVILI